MDTIQKLIGMGFVETTLVIIAVMFVVSYFAKLAIYANIAITMKSDSKGMKHLKHQGYNNSYKW